MRRLTPATLTFVMFGIIGMLVVGYVAKSALTSQEKKPAPPAMRDIPMAITDLRPGTVLTDKHLGMGKIPVEQLTREMLLTNRVIIGRAAKTAIKAAEPIKANQLYQPNEKPPLEVADDMRAVTVQVGDGASMVDGLIKPGDHVDVLFTSTNGNGTAVVDQGGLTMRLFEGVKILAINGSALQGAVDRGNNNVTLELTEPQANVMVLADDRGRITLTLNPNGKGNGGLALSNTERVTFYEILGLVRGEKAKEPFLTEIYRGPSRSALYFNDQGRYIGTRAPQSATQDPSQQYVLPPAPVINAVPQPNNYSAPAPAQMPTTGLPAKPQDNVDQARPVPTAALLQDRPN